MVSNWVFKPCDEIASVVKKILEKLEDVEKFISKSHMIDNAAEDIKGMGCLTALKFHCAKISILLSKH